MLISNRKLTRASEEELQITLRDIEGELIRREEEARRREESGLSERPTKRGHLRQEMDKCGGDCTCNNGDGHGPYWYFYSRPGGRLKKKYIGLTVVFDASGEPMNSSERKAYYEEKRREAEAAAKAKAPAL